MSRGEPPEPVEHCPRCGAEYRPGFDTCADCGIALEPGPTPAGQRGPEMSDREYERVLKDFRADPEAFALLATLPWADAVATANSLWAQGIEAVFVSSDDPSVPADPAPDPGAMEAPWDADDDDQVTSSAGEDPSPWSWGAGGPHWVWEDPAAAHAEAPDEDASKDEGIPAEEAEETTTEDDDEDTAVGEDTGDDEHGVSEDGEPQVPPPGLDRLQPGFWGRRVLATAALFVRVEDEGEARRVAGRRLGVL